MGAAVLVVGLEPLDSGKTTLAASIARALREAGYRVAVSKPVGAVDLWRSPWVLGEVERAGLVLSGDAVSLVRAAEYEGDVEAVNPLAFIMAPLDPERVEWRLEALERLRAGHMGVALMRVTACTPAGKATVQAVNLKALERLPRAWAERIEEAASHLRPQPVRAGDELVKQFLSGGNLAAADSCLKGLLDSSDVTVIESQSDVAAPTPLSAAAADVVVVAAPGKAAVYPGDRYARAINVLSGGIEAAHTLRVSDLTPLLKPTATQDLPLLDDPRLGYPAAAIERVMAAVMGAVG